MMVSRSRKLKKKKKKKKKRKKNQNTLSSNISIYPTEKSSEAYNYAKRGRTKEEKLSDQKARIAAQKRQRQKDIEDYNRYNMLMKKIGYKNRLERLYLKHFAKEIDTLDFVDEMDNILEGKKIDKSDLVFIREYLYKKFK